MSSSALPKGRTRCQIRYVQVYDPYYSMSFTALPNGTTRCQILASFQEYFQFRCRISRRTY